MLEKLVERGLSVAVDGDALVVSPASRLDDELRVFIRTHKPQILEALRDTVDGISAIELRELAGQDWQECERDPATLKAFAAAVRARRLREEGIAPPDWDSTTECAKCGSVPIFGGCPATVLACPWCWNRISGKPTPRIPRGP